MSLRHTILILQESQGLIPRICQVSFPGEVVEIFISLKIGLIYVYCRTCSEE